MRVYVVIFEDYDVTRIEGVFRTREDAEKYAEEDVVLKVEEWEVR